MFLNGCLLLLWCYFPASGLRDYPSGTFWGVGMRGYSWLSSSTGTANGYGTRLDVGGTNVYPLNNNSRTYGFPVRCVQELTLVCYINRRKVLFYSSEYH